MGIENCVWHMLLQERQFTNVLQCSLFSPMISPGLDTCFLHYLKFSTECHGRVSSNVPPHIVRPVLS